MKSWHVTLFWVMFNCVTVVMLRSEGFTGGEITLCLLAEVVGALWFSWLLLSKEVK